jgi:hypothetical protein
VVTKCEVLIFQGLIEHFVNLSKFHMHRASDIQASPGIIWHGAESAATRAADVSGDDLATEMTRPSFIPWEARKLFT